MRRNRAFTLIELIVVLVILAIIGLIVTPIVLNIIDKAEYSANKRSIDSYGKAIELAMASYKLENGTISYDINDLNVEYSGNKVECDEAILNKNGSAFITKCKVDGEYIEDEATDDGYYQYGKIIPDYTIGEMVTYNNMQFYVISDSNTSLDYITLLKAEPLTVNEVNTYGAGHINKYTNSFVGSIGTAYNQNGYGGMSYYTSETCGDIDGSWVETGCLNDYKQSDIKYAVDAWTKDKFKQTDLLEDSLGYKSRLITIDELTDNLGYEKMRTSCTKPSTNGTTPDWIYNVNYNYWTMSGVEGEPDYAWAIYGEYNQQQLCGYPLINGASGLVRPVVNLRKSAIEE